MNTRRQNSTEEEDRRTISGCNETPEPIPIDVITEILSRLPAKSVARFRCVSKLWASEIGRPYFTELFMTRSRARPQVLFACQKEGELFFFSSPQPRNPYENSSPLAASYLMKLPVDYLFMTPSTIRGLVLVRSARRLNGKEDLVLMICNPSTGQYVTLPKVEMNMKNTVLMSYFGYDPIGKQFKVLSVPWTETERPDERRFKIHVLTLGTKEPSWRRIKCRKPHFPGFEEVCINGVLYYSADNIIVCFDVRSEKFRFIRYPSYFFSRLICYNGLLGVMGCHNNMKKLWVLESAEREKWSEPKCRLPASWQETFGTDYLSIAGMTQANEIVLLQKCQNQSKCFCIFSYNFERNTVVRVELQGMEAFECGKVYPLLDYVEDVTLMQIF